MSSLVYSAAKDKKTYTSDSEPNRHEIIYPPYIMVQVSLPFVEMPELHYVCHIIIEWNMPCISKTHQFPKWRDLLNLKKIDEAIEQMCIKKDICVSLNVKKEKAIECSKCLFSLQEVQEAFIACPTDTIDLIHDDE